MKFDFFTLGGSQLWEDIFFYQKWRIQRHFESKKCRLLDPWDIQRHCGTFEECSKAFYKYIEIYELPRQKGHMIVMIHGLFDSKNIFKPLWRAALANKFCAAAVNYPSSQKSLDAHVAQFETFLNNLVDINEVSFVTKGVGALILRELLYRKKADWQKKIKVNRIVEIVPPNKGSKLLAKLSQYKLANLVFGPLLKDATPQKVAFIPDIDKSIEVGIINCGTPIINILSLLPDEYKYKFYTENEAVPESDTDFIKLPNWHFNPLKNKEIVNQAIYFIKNGCFKKIKKL